MIFRKPRHTFPDHALSLGSLSNGWFKSGTRNRRYRHSLMVAIAEPEFCTTILETATRNSHSFRLSAAAFTS
ncbi:hypothetical protein ACVWXO_010003 [Bradyrhizobium sp. LM2.7]